MSKGIIKTILLLIGTAILFALSVRADEEFVLVVREGDNARTLTEQYLVRPTAWERVVQYNYILKPGNIIQVPAHLVVKKGKAFIEVSFGDVEVNARGRSEWRPAIDGLILREGDTVRTGPDSGAAVVMGEGGIAILSAETEIIYEPYSRVFSGRVNRLNILRGEVEALIPPADEREAAYEIVTPDSIILLKGTKLRTKVIDGIGTRLEVLEGEVTVDSSGKKLIVEEGMGAVLEK